MTHMPPPLPSVILDPLVRLALAEDLGRAGDLTTDATIPVGTQMACEIRARKPGRLAGLDAAAYTLKLVDETVSLDIQMNDGDVLTPGDTIARLEGPARSILTAERVMLNFIGRLSGIATLTAQYVAEVEGSGARIVCTRKTTPGHRAVEKRAVRCGGGTSHRYGLDDAILIKDNHIAACGGVEVALTRARDYAGHLRMIEIEVDTLEQLKTALPFGPDAVLLDNMDNETLRKAVALIGGHCVAEASGGVTLDTVKGISQTGVDFISVGALTHSAINLDVGMDAA